MISRNLYVSIFLLTSCAVGLSGCVSAAVGIGTAAVAAETLRLRARVRRSHICKPKHENGVGVFG